MGFLSDTPLFDLAVALARKEEGMAKAASAKPALLSAAQDCARRIARMRGTVTADDVAEMLDGMGIDYAMLGNAAGSVFRGSFEFTGQVVQSRRPTTHGRAIKVWRLKP